MRIVMMLVAALVLALTGCSTPQERAAKEGQRRQAEMALMIAEYGPACTQVGYAQNTDPWRNCVVQQAANAEAKKGWLSTSIFGRWANWGRGGSSSGAGVGVGVGR